MQTRRKNGGESCHYIRPSTQHHQHKRGDLKLCLGPLGAGLSCSGECGDSKTSGQLLIVEIAAAGLPASGYLSPVLIVVL